MTAAETETMTELMQRAFDAVGGEKIIAEKGRLQRAMAEWIKQNHSAFEEPPLSFGERAAKAWLATRAVDPDDPEVFVSKWNHYYSASSSSGAMMEEVSVML